MNFTTYLACQSILAWTFSFPMPSNIKSIQCATQWVHLNFCFCFSIYLFLAFTWLEASSMITCTTFSSPISSTTSSRYLNINSPFLIVLDASIKNHVPVGLFTRIVIRHLLFSSVQLFNIIEYPYCFHAFFMLFHHDSIMISMSFTSLRIHVLNSCIDGGLNSNVKFAIASTIRTQ